MTIYRWGRYLRVSTEEQALPGTASIPAQDADTLALIQREGGVLVDTYQDTARYRSGGRMVEPSGERADRPEWKRLLADIASGRVNAVCAFHSSRLYRNYRPAIDFLELVERHNVTVRLCGESFDPRFAMLMAWRDAEENKVRASRSVMGKINAARKGYSPTRHSLFYRTLRDADGKRLGAELDPAYRAFFDEAARLFLAGLPYVQIAQRLGRNPVTGYPLHAAGVTRLFENPWYRGQVDYGRGSSKPGTQRFVAEGRHTAAWDAATVQAIEAERARRAAAGYSQAHAYGPPGSARDLFSGLARCGHCGRLMVAQHPHRARPHLTYYVCHSAWKASKGFISGPGLPHAPNSISQPRLLAEVESLAQAVVTGELDEATARFELPRHGPVAVAPTELAAQVAALRADLQSPNSNYARALLAAELERLERALAAAEAEYSAAVHPPSVSGAELRAVAAALLDALEQGGANLRPALAAFGVFYVAGKALAMPPQW